MLLQFLILACFAPFVPIEQDFELNPLDLGFHLKRKLNQYLE